MREDFLQLPKEAQMRLIYQALIFDIVTKDELASVIATDIMHLKLDDVCISNNTSLTQIKRRRQSFYEKLQAFINK